MKLLVITITCIMLAGVGSAAPTSAGAVVGTVMGEACSPAESQCDTTWALWDEHLGEFLPPPCMPNC